MNLRDILNGIPDLPDAACYGMGRDGDLFYPRRVGNPLHRERRDAWAEEAKAICADCTERTACLAWALEHDETRGVWGGLSEDERKDLMRR